MAPNPPSQPKISWFPLVLFAVFLYCLFLSRPELRASDESVFAAVAQDMLANGNWLNPHFQGQPIRCFPLYPWAVALCSFFFFPPPAWGAPLSPAAIRLPALLALLGLAAVAAIAAKRYRDREAGITAAAIVVSSTAALHVGLIAQNESFHALLLTAGWFIWYELGPQRQRWAAAWGCSLLSVPDREERLRSGTGLFHESEAKPQLCHDFLPYRRGKIKLFVERYWQSLRHSLTKSNLLGGICHAGA